MAAAARGGWRWRWKLRRRRSGIAAKFFSIKYDPKSRLKSADVVGIEQQRLLENKRTAAADETFDICKLYKDRAAPPSAAPSS